MEPYYEENSAFYIFSRDSFKKNKNRIGKSPYLYNIDPIEAIDIDNENELNLVEKILG